MHMCMSTPNLTHGRSLMQAGDCPFQEVCGFLHDGEVKLERRYGLHTRDEWICGLVIRFDAFFGVEAVTPKVESLC